MSIKGAKDKDKDKHRDKDKDKDKDKDRGDGTKEFPVTIPSRSSSDVEPDELISKTSVRDDKTQGHEARAGEKRKRYVTIVEGGKKRKLVDLVRSLPFPLCPLSYIFFFWRFLKASFDPRIQAEVEVLKTAIINGKSNSLLVLECQR